MVCRTDTNARGFWLSERSAEKLHARRTSRNQPILRFDVMLQHDWPIELCSLYIRVFFRGKTKSTCFDLFIRWLIKQITSTYRNHFSRSYENRSIRIYMDVKKPLAEGYVAEKIPSNTSTEKKKSYSDEITPPSSQSPPSQKLNGPSLKALRNGPYA